MYYQMDRHIFVIVVVMEFVNLLINWMGHLPNRVLHLITLFLFNVCKFIFWKMLLSTHSGLIFQSLKITSVMDIKKFYFPRNYVKDECIARRDAVHSYLISEFVKKLITDGFTVVYLAYFYWRDLPLAAFDISRAHLCFNGRRLTTPSLPILLLL